MLRLKLSHLYLCLLPVLLSLTPARAASFTKEGSTCTIHPTAPKNKTIDDAIAIREAFHACREDSKVVFISETYNISSVMVTTGLKNVQVEMPAYLQVGSGFLDVLRGRLTR